MKKNDYSDVKILLAMENPLVRQGMQTALHNAGYGRAQEVDSLAKMVEILTESRFDVILSATELGRDAVIPLLIQLRHGGLAHHPLPIIIPFLTNTEQDYVRRVIDVGPDDLLQMPVVPAQLLTRLSSLTEKRKTFLVTSDYVGPDRRTAPRPGTLPVPVLDVPNPLMLRIAKQPTEQIEETLLQASLRLRAMRLARYAFELQWLARAIRTLFEQNSAETNKLTICCDRIKLLLTRLKAVVPDEEIEAVAGLSQTLAEAASALARAGFAAAPSQLQNLIMATIELVQLLGGFLPADLLQSIGPGLS